MHGRLEIDMGAGVVSCDCHVAACPASTGAGRMVDSDLERLEARVDARLRRLAIADRLRSTGRGAAIVTGATVLVAVLL